MSETKWTKDQQDVISLRDRNILVSAAAGSGKTAVLVERIIQKITRDNPPCDIDKLLVVTFTKAAAAEMRSRIGDALEKKLSEEPENEHIQRQASLLHSAQITTIDSFCQWILRNYFHVIDLDPVYRVGDETDLEIMKQEVLEELLEERYAGAIEEGDKDFLHFANAFSLGRTDKNIEELVLTLYEKSTSYPFPEEWIDGLPHMYDSTNVEQMEQMEWMGELFSYLKICVEEYVSIAKKARTICGEEGGPEAYLPAIEADLDFLEKLLQTKSYCAFYELLSTFHADRLKAIRGKDVTVDSAKKETVKSLRESYLKKGIQDIREKFFFQTPEEMVQDMKEMASPVRELAKLTLEFGRAFAARKQEEQILDFADMEHLALKVLLERGENGELRPSSVAMDLQENYDEIMTDEYQDSNEVQELLLTSLCGQQGEPPYLFMVGDVKQSIYKFRMAEPEIFLEKYKRFTVGKGPNQRIDLHQNFRSRGSVLESANAIFEKIMQEKMGGIVYDEDAKLVPGGKFEECDKRTADQTELLLIERKGEEVSLEKKPLEASVIGARIQEMVQGENPLYIQGEHGYRPVGYGDIAILLRSVTGWAEEFVEALNDMGVPAFAETSTGYFTSLEVQTILNYLHIIDNPRQDIPLAAVLRSCLVGLTDEELAWVGTMPEGLDFFDKVMKYRKEGDQESLRDKLSHFWDRIERYREFAKTRPVYELLRKIYDETGYYQNMSAMPSGEKRRANLDILLQQSLEFAKNGHRGIYGFARYIESLQKSDVDFGEASLNGGNGNAVRIMTIHKSKGLEFPVVFVAGMGKQFNLTDARKPVVIDSEYGIGCDFVDLDMRVKQPTLVKRFIANQMVLDNMAEEIRVLYVALTRAKEKLFITGTVSGMNKKLGNWLSQTEKIDFSVLRGAVTYLDWIVPAVLGQGNLSWQVSGYLQRQEEDAREPFSASDSDNLFRLEVTYPEELVETQRDILKDELSQYEMLRNWDINKVYDEEMRNRLEQQISYVYPYRAEADLPVKISVSELKRQQLIRAEQAEEKLVIPEILPQEKEEEPDIPRPSFLQEEQELSGAARGTLYHMIMEHFPYGQICHSDRKWQREDFDNYLETMIAAGYLSRQERKVLDTGKFVAFMETDIGQRMMEAWERKALRLEQPFMMGLAAKDIYQEQDSDAMIMVQGIIDAFFFQEEEIVLIDYKTDSVRKGEEQELVKKYRTQLEYYAKALERLMGKPVREKIIYSFALGKEIEV